MFVFFYDLTIKQMK